jgi:hypothetical protein
MGETETVRVLLCTLLYVQSYTEQCTLTVWHLWLCKLSESVATWADEKCERPDKFAPKFWLNFLKNSLIVTSFFVPEPDLREPSLYRLILIYVS